MSFRLFADGFYEIIDKPWPANVNGLVTVTAATFAGKPAPERKWIIRDLIPDRNVTDLSGDGGIGKSLIALQLCMAMVTATDWLGHMPTPGPALYLSCEDELDEVNRRIEIIAKRKSIDLAVLTAFHIVDLTNADTELAVLDKGRIVLTALYQAFAITVQRLRPKLAVLDTRADVFGGNEIDRNQVRFFVRALRRLCFECDMAVLLLSHPSLTGISSGTGQSGSTAWGNSVRSRLYLEHPKAEGGIELDSDLRILTTKKQNFGPADSSIMLRWDAGIFRPDKTGASTLDRTARGQAVEKRFLELLKNFEHQGRHVNANAGPYYAPKLFAVAAQGLVNQPEFKAAMERLFTAEKIRSVPFGPPSRGTRKIVEVVV